MRTVGDILKDARLKQNKKLEEVEKETKIRLTTLQALESGDWDRLPPPTYVKGFIRNYGQYLGLNVSELLAFFRREYDEQRSPKQITPTGISQTKLRITPTTLVAGIISLVTILVGIYLFIQYQSFTGAPLLELREPKNNLKTSAGEVLVIGRTYADATLKINGQDVQLSPGGTFSVAVALVEGENDLVVTSTNRFGKISTEKRVVLVETPQIATITPTVATGAAQPKNDLVTLTLKIGPQSSWVHVETDGSLSFEGVLVSGSSKIFEAKEVIKFITGNAGSTKVVVNGGSEETLGTPGQRVEKEYHK